MSIFSMFTSSLTDTELMAKYIDDITEYNVEKVCISIDQLINQSKEINRKTVLPILDKVLLFLQGGKADLAGTIIYIFVRSQNLFFKPVDIQPIVDTVLKNINLQSTNILPILCSLCFRIIQTKDDFNAAITDKQSLVNISAYALNEQVLKFISKVSSIDTTIRVPFVFNGLFEKLLPSITTNNSACRLVSSLLKDSQSRKYFVEMGHIQHLTSALFDSELKGTITDIFRVLLSPDDLTHLTQIQKILFESNFIGQLVYKIKHEEISDDAAANTCLLIADGVQFRPLDKTLFTMDEILDIAVRFPGARTAILYMLEAMCLVNPSIIPDTSKPIEDERLSNDPHFTLFTMTLLYDHSSQIPINFENFTKLTGQALCTALVCATTRKIRFPNAEVLAQLQEDMDVESLASINCLVCDSGGDRLKLAQAAADFFAANKPANVGTFQPRYFPQSFLDWGSAEFGTVGISRWIGGTASLTRESFALFEREPGEAGAGFLDVCRRAAELRESNRAAEVKRDKLELEHREVASRLSQAEVELVEARCRSQLRQRP